MTAMTAAKDLDDDETFEYHYRFEMDAGFWCNSTYSDGEENNNTIRFRLVNILSDCLRLAAIKLSGGSIQTESLLTLLIAM